VYSPLIFLLISFQAQSEATEFVSERLLWLVLMFASFSVVSG